MAFLARFSAEEAGKWHFLASARKKNQKNAENHKIFGKSP